MADGNHMPGGARVTMRPAGVAGLLVDIATECGVSKPTDNSANAQVTTPQPPVHALLRKSRSASPGAVHAKFVLLLAPVLFTLTACGSSASTPSDNPPPSHSPNRICADQIYAMMTNEVVNGHAGETNETFVNGNSDPFINYSYKVMETFLSEEYQLGKHKASQKAYAEAQQICLTNQNPIRPNYPTNGNYPGQPGK